MRCPICNSFRSKIAYEGLIRDGRLGRYTKESVIMWQCSDCGVIWHDKMIDDADTYYESSEYRDSLEGTDDIEYFYTNHDKETLDKFLYTGTDIYRHKVVADIGCGGGAFLDFLKGVANTVVAVEPSCYYRDTMKNKGFVTYAYADLAKDWWKGKIDVITSFDVIEHVETPKEFMRDMYELLVEGGRAIIGTPTDAPVMRSLLGAVYEKKQLFSTQHMWVFTEDSLKKIAEMAGFDRVQIKYFQRYGIGNLLGWLREKKPLSDIEDSHITDVLNSIWKSECSEKGLADYIVLYAYKEMSV